MVEAAVETIAGVRWLPTGLVLERPLTGQEWLHLGLILATNRRATHWQIGDWWIAHRDHMSDEEVIRLLSELELDLKTVRNLASVCAAFPLEERVEGLSIGHHEAVMALPREERAALLQEALAQGWSVGTLREAVRKRRLGPRVAERPRVRAAERVESTDVEEWEEAEVEAPERWTSPQPQSALPLRSEPVPGRVRQTDDGWEHADYPQIRVVERSGRLLVWDPMARYTPEEARALAEVLLTAAEALEREVVL